MATCGRDDADALLSAAAGRARALLPILERDGASLAGGAYADGAAHYARVADATRRLLAALASGAPPDGDVAEPERDDDRHDHERPQP